MGEDMKYLFDEWNSIKEKLKDKFLMLFLDYDGTITPIAPTPGTALLPSSTRTLLETFSKTAQCKLTIISGRAVRDVKKCVGLKNINYVGNHGFEIEGPDITFEALISPRLKETLLHLKGEVEKKLCSFDGVFVEDKGLTFSVHYRLANAQAIPVLKEQFKKITKPYLLKKEIRVGAGKKVFEVKPPTEWDKGKAVLWILKKQQITLGNAKIVPLSIGDDATDEDVFLALRDKGVTIYVGEPGQSYAQYYLRDTDEVTQFLKEIQKFKKDE